MSKYSRKDEMKGIANSTTTIKTRQNKTSSTDVPMAHVLDFMTILRRSLPLLDGVCFDCTKISL
jgi:hypothetical protein